METRRGKAREKFDEEEEEERDIAISESKMSTENDGKCNRLREGMSEMKDNAHDAGSSWSLGSGLHDFSLRTPERAEGLISSTFNVSGHTRTQPRAQ